MKRMITIFVGLACLAASLLPTLPAVAADSNNQLFAACAQAPSSPICKDKNTTGNPINTTINKAANIVAIIAGVAAIIMIIISGLTMVTSAGNQEAVTNSRKRLLSAVIGLVIVALAWTITRFVTDKLIQ